MTPCSTTMPGTTTFTTPTLRSRTVSLHLKRSPRASLSEPQAGRGSVSAGGRRTRRSAAGGRKPLGAGGRRADGRRPCCAGDGRTGTGEAHLGYGAVGLVDGEERHALEAERPRDQIAGECLQRDVVVARAGVVVAPGVLDLVLGRGQRLL